LKHFSVFFNSSTFGRSIRILEKSDLRKILLITMIQTTLGVLDLFGVIAIGLLGALSINNYQTSQSNGLTAEALDFLNLAEMSFEAQTLWLGLSAVALLTGRTLLSIFFTRKILFFLGVRGARISENLVSRFLSQPLLNLQSKSPQNILYAVGDGVSIVTLQVIASSAILFSDLSLLVIMIIGLAVINPITTAYMIFVFSIVGVFLHGVIDKRAGALGQLNYKAGIKANEKIMEALSVFRELVVRKRRNYYARQIASIRFSQATTRAELSFMPYLSKYVIEAAVILGAVVIGLSQFFVEDVTQAVATMAIFLAAGSRLAPAVLRVQQGSVTIRTALAQAEPTLNLIESLSKSVPLGNVPDDLNLAHEGFEAKIEFNGVQFTYPGNEYPTLSEVSLCIPSGSFVAIVGPSGAGKTTLIDLMLGLLEPEVGSIFVSGLSPSIAISKWPGAFGYVPQEIAITSSTLRDNISLGYPTSLATDEHIKSCIKLSQLEEFVNGLDHGINTHVGEAGSKLSGGERQRLGIARAMFTNPGFLVLDEATSALDSETEHRLSESINGLKGKTTIVIIAHRLSTVREADLVVYVSSGKILATGSFSEVRNSVPEFDRQAVRMGF